MVEVNEKLYVTAEDFFTQIAESVAYDISDSTGKKVRPKQLHKGYSYQKSMKNKVGRKGNVKVVITEFDYPLHYSAQFHSINGINSMSYDIEVLEDGFIGVSYKEDFEGKNKTQNLNYKFMDVLYKKRAKKRAKRMLRAIESYIQENGNKVGTTIKQHLEDVE